MGTLTADLDLVIELTPENLIRGLAALSDVGLKPRLPEPIQQFANPAVRRDWIENRNMVVFQLWDPANAFRTVDIFVREPFNFDDMWQDGVEKVLEGTPIRIASIAHLVDMKRPVRRPVDLDDIRALEQIAAWQSGKS